MTDESLGTYTFLPWFRRGAAATLSTPETLSPGTPSRAIFPVELTVNARTVFVQARLYGPGDVVGLDQREVVRTEPQAGSLDFSPNYFAAVDFAREDLPWLFTPLRADGQGRLRPWLALVAVRRQPGVRLLPRGGGSLPVLEIAAPAVPTHELPDLAESWAWAHVQVSGVPAAGQTLVDHLEAAPHLGVSRLVCPQRLLPLSQYVACVVPAFRAGVQAGLGLEDEVADLAPSWDLAAAPDEIRLPVYNHWEFSTGERGDFESLARALRPRRMGPEVGQRPMDVGRPGPGLPEIADGAPGRVLTLEGALRSPETVTQPWPDAARVPFEQAVRAILDAPADAVADPVVGPILAPPLYGRWHALQERVPDGEPHWFRELNLDPRARTPAGAGTSVVQRDQEDLMEEAWRQIGDVLRANQELKRGQFARAVAVALRAKHVAPLPPDHLVHLTRPVHARVTLSPHTLHHEILRSDLPPAAVSGALRRLSRPRSGFARRLGRTSSPQWRSVAGRMNAGEIRPAEPRTNLDATADLDAVADAVAAGRRSRERRLTLLLALLVVLLAGVAIAVGGAASVLALIGVAAVGVVAVARARRLSARTEQAARFRTSRLNSAAVRDAPPRPDFHLVVPPEQPRPPSAPPSAGQADSEEARRFRAASALALERAQRVVERRPRAEPRPLDLPRIAARLQQRLDPDLTVVARVRSRVRIPPGLWQPLDPLEPVMAYPEFPRAMYEPLAEISDEFIIPGLEHVPPDTVTLLETNPPVIQAYMAGLNHEMARELLWREYPTDQRGSCFRQFWDPRGRLPQARTDAERRARYDVPEMHRWLPGERLGQSLVHGGEQQLVLLLRGELLRRFPTAMVFAERARVDPLTGRLEPEGTIEWPLFRGQLPPDVFFLGFALTEEQARGDEDDPGWYFVIQEQPTEPRFGLDEADGFAETLPPLTDWDHLSWGHLATSDQFEALRYVKLGGPLPETGSIHVRPDVAWGVNAAQMAFITLQKPVRIAIHARLMLPAQGTPDG